MEQHEAAADMRCESTETRRIVTPWGASIVCRACITDHRMPAVRGPISHILAIWEGGGVGQK
jgi:hypothetical protein